MAATDSRLTLLGLALRAGKLAVGEEPVRLALQEGTARIVLLAQDASDRARRKVEPKLGDVPMQVIPASKEELGRALGRESCAICAVTDKGFAQSLSQRFEQTNTNHDGGVTI